MAPAVLRKHFTLHGLCSPCVPDKARDRQMLPESRNDSVVYLIAQTQSLNYSTMTSKCYLYVHVLSFYVYLFAPTAIDCGIPGIPDNGGNNYNATTYLSTARYECNVNFELVGSDLRQCQLDGTWSGAVPVCRRIRKSLLQSHYLEA